MAVEFMDLPIGRTPYEDDDDDDGASLSLIF